MFDLDSLARVNFFFAGSSAPVHNEGFFVGVGCLQDKS